MSFLQVLSNAIYEKLPHLKELKPYTEIIVPKDFSQEHFSYTIINVLKSNSYIDNKKTWEGNVLHDEMAQIVTVKNNAISYELERYAVKDCIYYGQPIMLNNVLEFINKNQSADILSIMRFNDTFKWDLSKPYLKDQSNELIKSLAEML